MPIIHDSEFGEVAVRRSALAKYVRVRIERNGQLSASLPTRTPLRFVLQLIDQSRAELRSVVARSKAKLPKRQHNMRIGKSHILHISEEAVTAPKSRIANQKISVLLPQTMSASSAQGQHYINGIIRRVLKKEAVAYLPRRVHFLANQHHFDVTAVRFNNAKTRWGSCSNGGSINLNIALMQLPHELIDYVIIHELCHTRHMNHSDDFWQLVATLCPDYRLYRRELRTHHPYI